MRVIDFNMPLKEGFFKSKLFVGISTAVVILFLTQYVVPNVDDCFNRPKYARSIYTELLGNMKEVDKAIDSLAKRGNYVFENAKFSTAAYDKYYKPGFFGNSSLDQQLDNFYNAVKRFNPSYKIADFKRMEEHGRQSLQMLSKIGKIRDYDETKKTIKVKDENVVENVISADSSGASSDNAASATTIKQK